MASNTEAATTAVAPVDAGLKRDMGFIGAAWASETSIIGSGWLFGSLYAAQAVGGAAILDWVIAGVVVMVLALVHAELGAMYPVSGGTARFPYFAFGVDVVQAVRKVTRLPIEVHLMIQQPDRYARAFVEAGADTLIVHLEAYHDPKRTIAVVQEMSGVGSGHNRDLMAHRSKRATGLEHVGAYS